MTRRRNLTLPLQAIIPFFRGAKFLPPDFRFKFEIEVNTGRVIMRKDWQAVMNFNPTNTGPFWSGMSPLNANAYCRVAPNASGIEFQYPYHILRQPVQAAISSMWLQKPFLYNYETIQTTEVIPTLGSTFINFTISISTQRPTVIDAFLFPISTMALWEDDFTLVRPYSTTAGTTIPTGYRVRNTPHNHGDYSTTGIAKNSNQAGPCVWSDLEVMFSGRTAYRFLNNYNAFNAQGNDSIQPSEFFIQLFEEQSFRSTGTEYNAKSFVERSDHNNHILVNNQMSSRLLRLIVQPGGWADRGVISSRQGATTITLNINFRRPLSNQDRFVVLRTNPEQMVFDSDKNVTLIQWPAIKSNMGYLIPNITAAP
jgi:hypothetical protein